MPEIDDAKKWTCYFQNFPSGLTINFGTSDFCGTSHYYPDCDPQVNFDPPLCLANLYTYISLFQAPPDVEFFKSETTLGTVSMKNSLRDSSNQNVLNEVQKHLSNGVPLIFIIHGFTNDGMKDDWVMELKNAIISKHQKESKEVIVGIVQWGWGK